jgi:Catalase
MMQGFGVHTFRLVNDRGEGTFVKFHWKPRLGVHIDARLADDTEVVNDRSVVTATAAADEFPDQFVEEFAAALAPHRWWQRPTDPVPA